MHDREQINERSLAASSTSVSCACGPDGSTSLIISRMLSELMQGLRVLIVRHPLVPTPPKYDDVELW